MAKSHIEAFLTHLAVELKVSASTQNVALNALVFLYREVLGTPFGELQDVVRAKMPTRLPVVFSKNEVKHILANLQGVHWLMAALLYGTGMRLMEFIRLRVTWISTINAYSFETQKDPRIVLLYFR